mmetsp:Transcript_77012/g.121602  ORF Transcript_77012/g.121602 Transcript_77012/m.121602 type:complete len:99 (-) Transcript_77012:264-560(-)
MSSSTGNMLTNCVFAMFFAAAVVGALNGLGLVVRSKSTCPVDEAYSSCEMLQDLRCVLSFVLGASICCILQRGSSNECPPEDDEECEGDGKMLLICML